MDTCQLYVISFPMGKGDDKPDVRYVLKGGWLLR